MTVTFPTININGSHGPHLQAQWQAAAETLQTAIDTLAKVDVHGRDYPPTRASSEIASNGYREHQLRLATLRNMHKELQQVAEEIQRQLLMRAPR